MSRRLYSLIVICLLPLTLVYLLWRARKQPEYRQHWRERFACYTQKSAAATEGSPLLGMTRQKRQLFWLHAVSVGETRAAQPLVTALREHYPDADILFTHTTPTGRATSEALFGDSVQRCYLPYDTPWGVRRFLRHYQPTLALIMETELWPNLLAATEAAEIPALLINARLSERSAKGYARHARLSRETLGCLQAVGAQTPADGERLSALGAGSVTVTGNIKFDITPAENLLALGAELRKRHGERPTLLCASTREGEEALILAAWRAKVSRCDTGRPPGRRWPEEATATLPLLVIVPRHPQRFDAVAALCAGMGLRVQRRSANADVAPDTDVLLGDSMGELFAYYVAADVAFVGGSLLDFGCQNLIEPCSIGTPVLLGPSTYNFAEAAREALAGKAAIQIDSAEQLVDTALKLLSDSEIRQALGNAGLAFSQKHRGATARTMQLVDAALTRPAGR